MNSFFSENKYREYLRTLVRSRRRTVYAVEFDKHAHLLAAGNSAGYLNIFDLHAAAKAFSSTSLARKSDTVVGDVADVKSRLSSPSLSIDTQAGPIYSLFSNRELLFCGADSAILVYKWEHLSGAKDKSTPIYQTTVHASASHGAVEEPIETNAITGNPSGSFVFAATGSGTVESFTSDRLGFAERFKGGGPHSYLHCIAMRGAEEANAFLTGSDDGLVRFFDRRSGLHPQRVYDLHRLVPARNRAWVACIASDTDGTFATCGSGNRTLVTLHLSSGAILESANLDYVPNALIYQDGDLYCGGADSLSDSSSSHGENQHFLYRYNLECSEVGVSPVSSSGVYALTSHKPSRCIAAAGYSTRHRWHDAAELIDIYEHPPARSFSMAASELALITANQVT